MASGQYQEGFNVFTLYNYIHCLQYVTGFSRLCRGGAEIKRCTNHKSSSWQDKDKMCMMFFSDPSLRMSGKKKHLGLVIYLLKTTSIKQEQMLLYKSCLQQQNCEQLDLVNLNIFNSFFMLLVLYILGNVCAFAKLFVCCRNSILEFYFY